MKWLLLVSALACACADDAGPAPSLDGPYECGPSTCGDGQICLVYSSGSQCHVDPDAGIGQYQEYAWTCIELPRACDDRATCECVGSGFICGVASDGRRVDLGCI